MIITLCDRCKNETHFSEKCNFCDRRICRDCLKSQKRLHKLERMTMCKTCWGDLGKRSRFKSAK